MKDKHGVLRGHCKEMGCECLEYWLPPPDFAGGKHFCEYCNHLPGKHLRIVALGYCTGCGQDNCSEYEPEDEKSYSECQYCGCDASCHKGGEFLNKPVKTASSSVKVDASGAPVQTHAQGPCKCPGCPYGRRLDTATGAVLDYCSKSCAGKDSARQTQMTSSGSSLPLQASLDPAVMIVELPQGMDPKITKSSHPGSKSAHNPSVSSRVPSISICTKCNVNPANPGRKWCQSCFLAKPS